jgi:hypothetical protein
MNFRLFQLALAVGVAVNLDHSFGLWCRIDAMITQIFKATRKNWCYIRRINKGQSEGTPPFQGGGTGSNPVGGALKNG